MNVTNICSKLHIKTDLNQNRKHEQTNNNLTS